MNESTIFGRSLVESAEGAAASHERSCSERGGVEGREAAAAAEATGRSGWPRCLSGGLMASVAWLAEAASFQRTTSLTATRRCAATTAVEAVDPSRSNTGFRQSAASLFTSTQHGNCCCCLFLWEREKKEKE